MYKFERFDTANRFYADVKYKDKEEAKDLGAKWDWKIKKWYFENSRMRHEWDISHQDEVPEDMQKLDEMLFYSDKLYSIIMYLDNDNVESPFSSYDKLVNYLLNKYGPVPYDYFDENYNSNGIFNTRTDEGLEIHHIDENQYLFLSSPEKCKERNVPFECQKANRLVYCDKIEHLLLHIRIAEDYHQNELFRYYQYGVKTLISKINDYYEYETLPEDWTANMIINIQDEFEDYICLLISLMFRFISLGFKADFIKSILFSSRSNQFCSKVVNKFTEVTNFLNEYPISDEDIIIQDIFKNNLSK